METANDPEGTLQTQRVFPYTPDEVYAAFSDPARLAMWWGPKDFTNTFESFEFKTGGGWKFLMHGPDGHVYPNQSVFRELVAGARLIVEHISPPHFTLAVSLQPVEGGTRILWVQKFEDPKVAAAVRHIAEPGNEQNLDCLHMHLCAGLE